MTRPSLPKPPNITSDPDFEGANVPNVDEEPEEVSFFWSSLTYLHNS